MVLVVKSRYLKTILGHMSLWSPLQGGRQLAAADAAGSAEDSAAEDSAADKSEDEAAAVAAEEAADAVQQIELGGPR